MKFTKKISAWLLVLGVVFMFSETSCVAQKKSKKKKGQVEEVVKEEPKVEANPDNEFGCARFGPDKQQTLESASLYTEFYKQEQAKENVADRDYTDALKNWRYVFDNAPGLRQNTFVRGENMYKEMIEVETDAAKKEELIAVLFEIIEKRGDCWGQKGSALGRKAFYIASFYEGRDQEVFDLFDEAMDVDGNTTDPDIFSPYLGLLYGKVRSKEVDKSKFDALVERATAICDYNITNGTENAAAYEAAKTKITNFEGNVLDLEELERKKNINDCASAKAFFQPKLAADPNNIDLVKEYFGFLQKVDCTKDSEYYRMIVKRADIEPDVPRSIVYTAANVKLNDKDYAAAKNYLNRALGMYGDEPEYQGKINYTLAGIEYSEKNYTEATRLYNAAFNNIDDIEKKGAIKMKLANMAYRLDDFPTARKYAEEAMTFMPNSGDPYMLIGQLYASSGKLCGPGTGWDSQVVVWCAIDAWYKAKQIDSSVADKAQEKINKYSQYFPTKQDAFMSQGKSQGDSYFVPCWIQRSTTVRLK